MNKILFLLLFVSTAILAENKTLVSQMQERETISAIELEELDAVNEQNRKQKISEYISKLSKLDEDISALFESSNRPFLIYVSPV